MANDERLTPAEYRKRRDRAALAERRRRDERTRDPEVERALIAWVSGGRVMPWREFLREWFQTRG
jgi:hypothetical protein